MDVDWPHKELLIIHPRKFRAGLSSSQSSASSHVLWQLFWMYWLWLLWKLKTKWEPGPTLHWLVYLLLMRLWEWSVSLFSSVGLSRKHIKEGNTSGTYCVLIGFARTVLRVLGIASLFHLAIMNVERYIAIKHSLRYEIIVTEARLIGVSALLWTITLLSKFLTISNYIKFDIGLTSLCIATIFVCQVVLCFETRRHENEIASQQVSVEAREKFLKEKKALKLTTTVIFCIIICYLPIIISRSLTSTYAINSVNSVYFVHFSGVFAVISNSLLNALMHCVPMKQFRLALKELLIFRKGN